MQFLHTLIDSLAAYPLLAAALLGLLAALNPCQLAINLSALTYLGPFLKRGLTYVLGRGLTYLLLGWGGCFLVLQFSFVLPNHLQDTELLSYLEKAIFLLVGTFFLYRFLHVHRHDGSCHNSRFYIRRDGRRGPLLLGCLLALLFCPESAVIFFGMMLPIGAMNLTNAILVPFLFAVTSLVPLLILLFLFYRASATLQRYERAMDYIQRITNMLLALLFIILAIFA